MTAARVVSIPFRGLRVACSKVIAQGYRSEKCIRASYIMFCCWIGIYLFGVEMNLRHAHKTRFWYHLGVFSKFFDDHPRQFYLAPENWNTTDIKPSQLSTKFKAIWSQFVVVPVRSFIYGWFIFTSELLGTLPHGFQKQDQQSSRQSGVNLSLSRFIYLQMVHFYFWITRHSALWVLKAGRASQRQTSRLATGAARACLDVSAKPVSLVLKHKTFT